MHRLCYIVFPQKLYRISHLVLFQKILNQISAPHLTKITRDQSFITWLAAVNERTNRVIVLRAVRWRFQLNIDVNPNNELGKRAKLVGKIKQEKPRIQNGANYIPVRQINGQIESYMAIDMVPKGQILI